MSGTPAVTDTGAYLIKLLASDRKGGTDSLLFTLRVTKSQDSIIRTYGKPFLDGKVNIGSHDWLAQWQVAVDPDTDSRWNPRDTMNNELLGLFATWDADSLYLGVQYVINDAYNTMMLYLDAGIAGGVTNFNSNQGYNGDYAKNFRFRSADGIDFFIADYYRNEPSFFKIDGNTTINLTDSIHGKRGPGGYDMEIAVAWNNLYGRGAGKVPSNVVLKIVSVVAGGFNYGAGDACPDNPDVDGNAGPDSLINLVSIKPDLDGDGLPDPTIILNADDDHFAAIIPSEFILFQNYPNPFNPVTTIKYQTPPLSSRFEKEMAGAMFVSLKVYDVLGREVAKLVDEMQRSGTYAVTFNGSALPSGIYFYELRAGNFSATKKLVLMK
jgi:hypothetical protein